MLSFIFNQRRDRKGSDVTGFVSFDNSTCKRVLDLLEPGDLRLWLCSVLFFSRP